MIDLKNVINNYPECLDSASKFKSYMLDLHPDNTNKARIRILTDMVDCGIAAEIKNGKTDNWAVVNYCNTMENQYGYSEKLVKECVDLFIAAFGFAANILSDSVQAEKEVEQTESERKQPHRQITHKNDDVEYICNLDGFDIDDGVLKKYKGHDQFVAIPNNVTSIGCYAFIECTSLTSLNIPDSVTSIWEHAFRNCKSLTSISIPDSVRSIDDFAFAGCTSLTSIAIHDSVTRIGWAAFYDTAYYNDPDNWENESYEEALVWYNKAAVSGHIKAQVRLAFLYENGLGTNLDYTLATYWYRTAAEKGDADAQNNYGIQGLIQYWVFCFIKLPSVKVLPKQQKYY